MGRSSCFCAVGLPAGILLISWTNSPRARPATFRDLDTLHGGIVPRRAEEDFVMGLVPAGMTMANASKALQLAGARSLRSGSPRESLFAYAAIEIVDHEPQDWLVLIRLFGRDSRVCSVMVERTPCSA